MSRIQLTIGVASLGVGAAIALFAIFGPVAASTVDSSIRDAPERVLTRGVTGDGSEYSVVSSTGPDGFCVEFELPNGKAGGGCGPDRVPMGRKMLVGQVLLDGNMFVWALTVPSVASLAARRTDGIEMNGRATEPVPLEEVTLHHIVAKADSASLPKTSIGLPVGPPLEILGNDSRGNVIARERIVRPKAEHVGLPHTAGAYAD